MIATPQKWDWSIDNEGVRTINKKEIWSYRHLIVNLVRRDLFLTNQQTILGPFWLLLQPLLTLVTYVFVFSKLIGLSTNDIPPVLFYYSGIILWNLFSECFMGTGGTFKDNIQIFTKVYLPRLVMPLSVVLTQLFRFLIQFFLLCLMILYHCWLTPFTISVSWLVLLVPVAVLSVACFGFGLGLLCSVMAAKYKDLFNLIGVIIRLMMFATPVFYPITQINKSLVWLVQINPLTSLFELFRYTIFGSGLVQIPYLAGSFLLAVLLVALSIKVFRIQSNKILDVV